MLVCGYIYMTWMSFMDVLTKCFSSNLRSRWTLYLNFFFNCSLSPLSSSGTSIMHMLVHLLVSSILLRLCSSFFSLLSPMFFELHNYHWSIFKGLPWWLVVKNPPANARDVSLIPGLGRSLGEGNGNPLQ